MNRILSFAAVTGLALVLSACSKPAPAPEPAQKEAATEAKAAAKKTPAATEIEGATAKAEAAAEATTDKTAVDSAADKKKGAEEAPADPDKEEGTWAAEDADRIDREKLAKAYTEVYCAQKKGNMDKLLDIYKTYGFEKPEDFISTWVEAARDTAWVTKVASDAAAKCR